MAKTFFVVLRQLVAPAGEGEKNLPARAAARIGCPVGDILSCQPVRRSLDARKRRGKAVRVYHVRLELPNRWRRHLRKTPGLDVVFESGGGHLRLDLTDPAPPAGVAAPLVVGAGPAGLFAALRLARAGWKPVLVERGDRLDKRRSAAADFWRRGVLDPESNVLYGEGGAGLFSDGKLNTRHKDREGLLAVLRVMVEAGAPESILVDAEPHVGSDLLGGVVEGVAAEIRRFGGAIRYRTRLEAIHVENGVFREAVLAGDGGREQIAPSACVLAVGHSARDTYEMLHRSGVILQAKPFAVGLRVELPQDAIDRSQRNGAFSPGSGRAASFRLSRAPEGGAGSCYTFCMCPGGQVIACASEPECLAVNGMSYHARAGDWGNAAFLSPVAVDDFTAVSGDAPFPLAGIAFQRHWERKAYLAGLAGGKYAVPAQRLADYVGNRLGPLPGRRGVARAVAAPLGELLPERAGETLRRAIPAMLGRLRQVKMDEVLLYGVETRTSGPVRIMRSSSFDAENCSRLFPAGEGSGYAGGIMTSALDGWKAAEALMRAMA